MIDLLSKLPDTLIAVLVTGGAWFGFNYAVLAERAMDREIAAVLIPACAEVAQRMQPATTTVSPRLRIGELFGLPELDTLQDEIVSGLTPAIIPMAEWEARCACAAATSSDKLRLDYALHTASFRVMPVSELSTLRSEMLNAATAGTCQ